jgi:hypothetical protein
LYVMPLATNVPRHRGHMRLHSTSYGVVRPVKVWPMMTADGTPGVLCGGDVCARGQALAARRRPLARGEGADLDLPLRLPGMHAERLRLLAVFFRAVWCTVTSMPMNNDCARVLECCAFIGGDWVVVVLWLSQ